DCVATRLTMAGGTDTTPMTAAVAVAVTAAMTTATRAGCSRPGSSTPASSTATTSTAASATTTASPSTSATTSVREYGASGENQDCDRCDQNAETHHPMTSLSQPSAYQLHLGGHRHRSNAPPRIGRCL